MAAALAVAQTAAPPATPPANPGPQAAAAPEPALAAPEPAPRAQPPPTEVPKGLPPVSGSRRSALEKQKASVSLQRQAIRRQAETAGNWMRPFEGAKYVDTACEPIGDTIVAPLIAGASQAQNLKPEVLRAVIDEESGFHPCAVSSRGAEGLMQLMPDTAEQLGVRDPFDPRQNIEGGAKFLKELLDRYGGDLAKALAAYNAGPALVDEAGGVPDLLETQNYVQSILEKLGAGRSGRPVETRLKPPEN